MSRALQELPIPQHFLLELRRLWGRVPPSSSLDSVKQKWGRLVPDVGGLGVVRVVG